MKEIISIHLGGFGINAGKSFWQQQCFENGMDNNGNFNKSNLVNNDGSTLSSYFVEQSTGKYKARAILVDSDKDTLTDCFSFESKDLYDEKWSTHIKGPCTNWAASHYTSGAEQIDSILNNIRNAAESCDSLEGISFFSSTAGNLSSGLSCLLMQKVREEYSDKSLYGLNLFSSPTIKSNILESYNSLLTLGYL